MNAMGIPPEKPPRKYAYGFPDHTPGLKPFPSITLGTATVSPINMANGYATIANGGRFHAPYIIEKVVDQDGETLYDHSVSDKQAIDEDPGRRHRLRRHLRDAAGRAGGHRLGGARARPPGGRQDRYGPRFSTASSRRRGSPASRRSWPRRSCTSAARARQARRLAADLRTAATATSAATTRPRPGPRSWRGHGGRRGRGLPGAGVRRRRGADRGPPAHAAADADQEADPDRDAEHDRPADQDADHGARRRPRRPAADDRGAAADAATTPTDPPTPTPTCDILAVHADGERHARRRPRGRQAPRPAPPREGLVGPDALVT